MSKIEFAQEAMKQFEVMEWYRKHYNAMSDSQRAEMSIGGRTAGQYAMDNYLMAKARFEYYNGKASL